MKKITKLLKPKESKFIFTEGINYFKTSNKSIWGTGYRYTLKLLRKIQIHGKWLNLAAGDGRYNLILLKKVDFVVASDIDESALSKLWYMMPKEYRSKLGIKVFDMSKPFPFDDNLFDGVFCTGILHLFPKSVSRKIFHEIDRILKPNGKIVIEFVTDIRRVASDGKLIKFGDEPQYTLNEAKSFLKNIFKNYKIRMYESEVPEENFKQAKPPYKFSCKFILLLADKY